MSVILEAQTTWVRTLPGGEGLVIWSSLAVIVASLPNDLGALFDVGVTNVDEGSVASSERSGGAGRAREGSRRGADGEGGTQGSGKGGELHFRMLKRSW